LSWSCSCGEEEVRVWAIVPRGYVDSEVTDQRFHRDLLAVLPLDGAAYSR